MFYARDGIVYKHYTERRRRPMSDRIDSDRETTLLRQLLNDIDILRGALDDVTRDTRFGSKARERLSEALGDLAGTVSALQSPGQSSLPIIIDAIVYARARLRIDRLMGTAQTEADLITRVLNTRSTPPYPIIDTVGERIRRIVAEHLDPSVEVRDESRLRDDLCADNLDYVELSTYINEEFSIDTADRIGSVVTVSDLVTVVREAIDSAQGL
jgi:acyl carrier protein